MSRATADDQLRFLLSCVKFSNNGRVDFVEVAKECGVVSKGAAAKRYERLLKANGIIAGAPNAASTAASRVAAPTAIKSKVRDSNDKTPVAKKRKLERNDGPAGQDGEKKYRSTKDVVSQTIATSVLRPELLHSVSRSAVANSIPHGPGGSSIYMQGPSLMGHSLPPYAMQHRSGVPGHTAYGHPVVQDVAMYPPFATTSFRESWNVPSAPHDDGFEEYVDQGYASHQQPRGELLVGLESLPMRIPPPPQEVVPVEQPREHHVEEAEGVSKSRGGVVVVE